MPKKISVGRVWLIRRQYFKILLISLCGFSHRKIEFLIYEFIGVLIFRIFCLPLPIHVNFISNIYDIVVYFLFHNRYVWVGYTNLVCNVVDFYKTDVAAEFRTRMLLFI